MKKSTIVFIVIAILAVFISACRSDDYVYYESAENITAEYNPVQAVGKTGAGTYVYRYVDKQYDIVCYLVGYSEPEMDCFELYN